MAAEIFVTATDTGAGKTLVTASLVRALKEVGRDVIALKPVASGNEGAKVNPDVAELLKAQGWPETEASNINLYSFRASLAPSQAAAEEGRDINPKQLLEWCGKKCNGHDVSLIEGVGGLMVPLAQDFLVSDWLASMPEAEVLLVVRARLGGINHTLLTLDKLRQMDCTPRWVVINDADHVGDQMLRRLKQTIAPQLPSYATCLSLPHMEGAEYAIADSMADLAIRLTARAE